MASIGISKSTFLADISVSKYAQHVHASTQKMASGEATVRTGNKVAYDSMKDTFKIDLAGKNAAVKSMSFTQSYLATTINVLDNASDMLARMYELAVLAANSTNTAADNVAIDMETERLSDRFHNLMSTAQFKGREIFQDSPYGLVMAADGNGSEIQFGVGNVDYDAVYDYTNPGVNVTKAGVTYEVKRRLTDEEKDAIIAQTEGLTREDLVVGKQFTTLEAPEPGVGVTTDDLYYLDGDGSVAFDRSGTVVSDENFNGGFLEIEFTNNGEASDNLTLVSGDGSAGTITINGDIITYVDAQHGAIEIGEITSNGQAASSLKIDFYEDASIPGTSNLLNGDFSDGLNNWNTYLDRVDFGSTFDVNGIAIPTISDLDMAPVTYDEGSGNPDPSVLQNDNVLLTGGYSMTPTVIVNGAGRLELGTGEFEVDTGYGIVHGPAVVSDAFAATQGDILKLDYSAVAGGDDFHVAGYLIDSNDQITLAINETGKDEGGTISIEVPSSDDYRFVFVTGSFDRSGGQWIGASMTIDNIRAENPFNISNDVVQTVLRSINYSSSDNNQASVKDVLVTLNNKNDEISLTDESKIFNSEFNGKIMLAPSKDLENAVSLGGSNNLGPDGRTMTNLVTYNIEVAQERINKARVYAAAKYAAIESAIDTATDLRSQFSQLSGTLSDINFSLESAHFAKKQMMESAAAAILAQSNRAREGLLLLV